jgi:tryptophan halogenase
MAGPIEKILIVGGGTAGWLTAAYLARRLGAGRPGGVTITLIESSEIGVIGVGEGTFPTMKRTLGVLGIDEAVFMKACTATFKQGIHYVDWAETPTEGRSTRYYHPFNLPEPVEGGLDLTPYWLMGLAGDLRFAEAVGLQDRVCDACRAPKRFSEPPFHGALNYAYHFDAGRMAAFLAAFAQGLGVKRLIGTVEAVELGEDGAVARLKTREHGDLKADLYVDCSGFRAALVGEALGSAVRRVDDVLFVDRALAVQVPYAKPNRPIASATLATAHEAGWSWDIGLNDRRGVGYVFSSRHTDEARAEAVLRRYIGPEAEGLEPRLLKLTLGYRERPWLKNCVAVGLAAGFLEPLESTGIVMIETAAEMICDLLPASAEDFAPAARSFNRAMNERFARAVDFLKLHYALSRRTDNAFWTDNADRASWTDSLVDHLDRWRHRPPNRFDLSSIHEGYPVFSYQAVLYGMGFQTDLAGQTARYPHVEAARRAFREIAHAAGRASTLLPDHRALVEATYGRAGDATSAARAAVA